MISYELQWNTIDIYRYLCSAIVHREIANCVNCTTPRLWEARGAPRNLRRIGLKVRLVYSWSISDCGT